MGKPLTNQSVDLPYEMPKQVRDDGPGYQPNVRTKKIPSFKKRGD
ncbi:hypothetical protein RG47T_4791 [Mucilaginibacter polytrichastri]|uniref:Uncharacterized protein n=1 Tax=Mucilaginibacter polytrichastri TaxID=1302689 RepID=A0A1Q6A5M2_9SPHI|nr:hypothetical protein RG47T_4791 [Mucilaginibacter polytrichastri]